MTPLLNCNANARSPLMGVYLDRVSYAVVDTIRKLTFGGVPVKPPPIGWFLNGGRGMPNLTNLFNYHFESGISSDLSAPANSVFFALLYKANLLHFPDKFILSNGLLSSLSGVTFKSLPRIRKRLISYRYKDTWIIKYKPTDTGQSPTYEINYYLASIQSKQESTPNDVEVVEELELSWLYPTLSKLQEGMVKAFQRSLGVAKRPNSVVLGHTARLASVRMILEEDGLLGTCDICETTDHELVLHHLHYKTWGKETPEDMALVCHRCHALVHKGKRNDG